MPAPPPKQEAPKKRDVTGVIGFSFVKTRLGSFMPWSHRGER